MTAETGCEYVTEIELDTGESLEVWRDPGKGLFAVDSTFLDQVSQLVYVPFDGRLCKLSELVVEDASRRRSPKKGE